MVVVSLSRYARLRKHVRIVSALTKLAAARSASAIMSRASSREASRTRAADDGYLTCSHNGMPVTLILFRFSYGTRWSFMLRYSVSRDVLMLGDPFTCE